MRLKKGDRVEVMNNKEASVSYRVAEMLSGNDHTYRVAYDSYPGMASQKKVETVSRKFVRPCQPLVQGVENYISGDKRILLGKSSQCGEDAASNKPSTSICYQQTKFQIPQYARVKKQHQKESMNILDEYPLQESHNHSRLLKRKSTYGSSIIEACNGHTQKFRGIKDSKKQKLVAAPLLEKVDAVAYPTNNLGEKNMHTSFKFKSTGFNQMKGTKLNDVFDCPGTRNSQSNSSDSDDCSVGSCSVTDQSPNYLHIPSIPLLWQETDAVCSDAESFHGSGSDRKSSSNPPEEDVAVSIRRLELQAYCRTLEALYASGPLSWEQEAMLTNLRIMLHISNDEHLIELKNLISAKTAKPYRTMTCSSWHLNLGLHVWYILRTRSSTSLLFTEAHLEARFICFQGLTLTPGFAAFVLA